MDPRLSLAIAIQSNPGVYAILVGSGLSRSAEIPTGWEITLDLVDRLAQAKGADHGGQPAQWFQKEFNDEPGYSALLARLGKTGPERQALLRAYFEPTEEERAEGLKAPSPAHRAIARLAASGHVRVIVTTNFDRLLELALEDAGVRPVVVANEDAARGAVPLVHAGCYVLKVHGDYLDTRIRNTEKELDSYPKAIRDLLGRIFDDYGLIVCGWSGQWDTALRGVLQRAKARRYSTYWTSRNELSEEAAALVAHRDATIVSIESADDFFVDLERRVSALEEVGRPHPLSVESAAVTLKRLLPDPVNAIQLRDFVHHETEHACGRLGSQRFAADGNVSAEELSARLLEYEAVTEVLSRLFAVGAYWCEERHVSVWVDSIQRIANPPHQRSGTMVWIGLWRYPATILLYAAGVVALHSEKHVLLHALLFDVHVRGSGRERWPLVREANSWVMDRDVGRHLPEMGSRLTPTSDRLQVTVQRYVGEFIPDADDYVSAFDTFEYLVALSYADTFSEPNADSIRAPIGAFAWRWREGADAGRRFLTTQAESLGAEWPLLQAGFFQKSDSRFKAVQKAFDKFWFSLSM